MVGKVIAIVGPTASGKTGIGVRLAKEFDGEIVSADSRQVYRGLDIGTGKEGVPNQEWITDFTNNRLTNIIPQYSDITIKQLRQSIRRIDGISQWMIDIVDPMGKMTLFDYLPLARLAIEDILNRGKIPIIVGGTGLYVQGLVEGFELEYHPYTPPKLGGEGGGINSNTGVIPDLIRDPLIVDSRLRGNDRIESGNDKVQVSDDKLKREDLDNLTIIQLKDILRGIDPEKFEKVDKKNRHRLIRAIELAQEGLVPVKKKPDFGVLQIGIDVPRQELHKRIDRRVDERFEQGMGQEVINLIKSGVSPEWLKGLGLEYREITDFVMSNSEFLISNKKPNTKYQIPNTEFEQMKQQLKFKIHQFARRQMTWFRRFPEINWLSNYNEMKRFVDIYLSH